MLDRLRKIEMKATSKKKLAIVATAVLVGGAIVYLVGSSFGEAMIYYKTVDELLSESARFDGKPIRVYGSLVPDSIRQKPGTDQFLFRISKRGKTLEVAYKGFLPDSMQEGQEVVAQGMYSSSSKTFNASEILTKCPSKHEARAKGMEIGKGSK